MWKDRTEILIGKNGAKALEKARVAVIGIGGVGGYVCHLLARAGVGQLSLVDFDVVDETNINRQVVADINTIGRIKVDVMKEQIEQINPKCNVKTYNERFCGEFVHKFFQTRYDYVVDAIDSVQDKIELICYCKEHDIKIVSAMGAGNRIGVPNFKIVDIYKTANDGLAKVLRKKLKERNVKHLAVAIAEELPIKTDKKTSAVGSISYYPAACGCTLSAYVINEILK